MAKHIITLIILIGLIAALVLGTEMAQIRLLDRIATHLCISLILVLGLQVFMGNSGILSFAHIGFMGVGAYVSAVLTIPVQMKGMALPDLYPWLAQLAFSPYVGIILGGLAAAAVAASAARSGYAARISASECVRGTATGYGSWPSASSRSRLP